MLRIVLRKMLKTRWMIICLLIGVIVAASTMSCIPQYTGGILQKVLTKDFENYQAEKNIFPGTYYIKYIFPMDSLGNIVQNFDEVDSMMQSYFDKIKLPSLWNVNTLESSKYALVDEGGNTYSIYLNAMTGMQDHVKMKYGNYPSSQKTGDVYEVMVSTLCMRDMSLNPGQTYVLKSNSDENLPSIKVKIAGVYEAKNQNDSYWYAGDASLTGRLFFDYDLFKKDFGDKDNYRLTASYWYEAFDYHKITLNNIDSVTTNLAAQSDYLTRNVGAVPQIPALSILQLYNVKQKQLRTLLWVLDMPVFLMLIFYLFMVAQLIINEEKNEIAVLKSRGATQGQIFKNYFHESLIMGGFALIFGPLLGLILSKMLGASNGFLEFIQRTTLPVHLDYQAFLYALIAIGVFIVTMLTPAYFASKTTIVAFKQQSISKKTPVWKRFYLDIVLLLITIYGIYSYKTRSRLLQYNVGSANNLPIDPLLVVISTFFILGAGLLFIRIYPLIIRFVFFLGKRFWKPSSYASLLYVSRSGGMNQFLILFLIFTVSIGIFNAAAARTINTNTEEKIKYAVGADMVLTQKWETVMVSSGTSSVKVQQFIEPDFGVYKTIPGISLATKVYNTDSATVNLIANNQSVISSGGRGRQQARPTSSSTTVKFMAVIPSDFGKVAWFKPSLLPYHWYNYLNVLTKYPQCFLLSSAFRKDFNIAVGDNISVKFGSNGILNGIVAAFVDYWPSFNPNEVVDGKKEPYFIVGNLNYFQTQMPILPYQVWIKKSDGASSNEIYAALEQKHVVLTDLKDMSAQIIASKNDAILEGINGALTLSFLVTMLIAAVGFLIYWIMSIRSRVLQFGILRAMGLSFSELIRMLLLEQLLISFLSFLVGIFIGDLTSGIFVPMLQMAFDTTEQVPPFQAVVYVSDYLKVFVVMAVILLTGLIVLSTIISRIKMSQALKLGED